MHIPRLFSLLSLLLMLSSAALSVQAQFGAPLSGSGFVVFGRVYLPNGKPASRVKVYLEMPSGLHQQVISDDSGNYEFRAVGRGRYHMKATNPEAPDQYTDPTQSDSTRAYGNRVQIDIHLRLPAHGTRESVNPGTISVAESLQDIPKPARKAYEQGLKLQKENQTEAALAQFDQALKLYPTYFQALTERANLLMQQNKLAESELEFARALQLNEKYAPALRGLGYCQIQQQQFQAAVSNLEKAYILERNMPLTLLLLGYANLSLNRYEEAKQSLQQALKLAPEKVPRAHVYLAQIFAHEQKYKEAADSMRTYLNLNPNIADAANLRKLEADWRARSKSASRQP